MQREVASPPWSLTGIWDRLQSHAQGRVRLGELADESEMEPWWDEPSQHQCSQFYSKWHGLQDRMRGKSWEDAGGGRLWEICSGMFNSQQDPQN